jgi:hypothetical protein
MTKPFSSIFGTGAPVRSRKVWSGADRLYPAIIGASKDPVKIRGSIPSVSSYGLLAHNGLDAYVFSSGTGIYTTPDLQTATSRSLATSVAGPGASLVYFKGSFFYASNSATPAPIVQRSADKGVTWTSSSLANASLSVIGDTLYACRLPLTSGYAADAGFQTLSDPAGAVVSRAFSRASYWVKVAGNANRQYAFAKSAWNSASLVQADVSTNGTSFSQDAAYEALAARAPSGAVLSNVASLANGAVMVFSCTSSGLFSLVADSAGAWSIGASLPQELDGYRFVGIGSGGSYNAISQSYTDSDGVAHYIFIVQDAAGNYLARIGSTYDGKEWRFLPPHYNFGTTLPTVQLGVFSKIDGTPLFHATVGALAEANMNAVELYYEV